MAAIIGRTSYRCFLAWHFGPIETNVNLVNLIIISAYEVKMVFFALKADSFGELFFILELSLGLKHNFHLLHFLQPAFEILTYNCAIEGFGV